MLVIVIVVALAALGVFALIIRGGRRSDRALDWGNVETTSSGSDKLVELPSGAQDEKPPPHYRTRFKQFENRWPTPQEERILLRMHYSGWSPTLYNIQAAVRAARGS